MKVMIDSLEGLRKAMKKIREAAPHWDLKQALSKCKA
jgi:hypothetical protein